MFTMTKNTMPSTVDEQGAGISTHQRLLLNTRVWVIAAVVLAVPFVLTGAGRALSDRNNDVRQWLPSGFQETQRYDWFLEHFGSEEFAVVSWDGASLDDQRVPAVADRLSRFVEPESGQKSSPEAWFREILTGPDVLTELESGAMKLSRSDAVERMRGSLLGPDGNTTGIIVKLSDEGLANRHAAVAAIRTAVGAMGVDDSELHLGGPTIDSVALDEQSEQSRYLLTAISVLLSSVAAWRCLRSLTLVAIVLLTSIFCGAAALSWIAVFGDQLNMIMVTMPTLVYVLTVSGAIHVTHYFKAGLQDGNRRQALLHAFQTGWLPCVLTAVTTAIGLGSLTVSHVLPVKLFGFYSALGVMTSLPVILFFLPAVYSWLPSGIMSRGKECSAPDPQNTLATRFGTGVLRHHAMIVATGLVVMFVAATGLSRLKTSVRIVDFFSPQSRVIADYRWLEKNLGPLVPVEIVVTFPADDSTRMTARVDLIRDIQQAVAMIPSVNGAMSAATYIPTSDSRGVARMARRAAMQRRLQNHRGRLVEVGYLADAEGAELWRVSARVAALADIDYGRFVETLKAAVEPVLAGHAEQQSERAAQVNAVYTGMVPLIYKSQRVVLEDLTISFFSAFALIGLVMLFLMRGVAAGLVTMIPNTFPAVIVFGMMGWSGRMCDIGAMITASVALGIAVDDTIHFMSWFRRGLASGLSRQDAVLNAYQNCAKAMLQTTTICGMGMLGFVFSSFGPTSGFATLMAALLITALIGDLIFLPALLASPLGRAFEPRAVARGTGSPSVLDEIAAAALPMPQT